MEAIETVRAQLAAYSSAAAHLTQLLQRLSLSQPCPRASDAHTSDHWTALLRIELEAPQPLHHPKIHTDTHTQTQICTHIQTCELAAKHELLVMPAMAAQLELHDEKDRLLGGGAAMKALASPLLPRLHACHAALRASLGCEY